MSAVPLQARSPRRHRIPRAAWAFLLPGAIVYTLFMVYPLLDSTRLSFLSGIVGKEHFVGLANYTYVFSNADDSSQFWPALWHTAIFTLIQLLVQNPIALLLAEALSRPGVRGRGIYRALIFVPTTISIVIAAFIWNLILSPLWGLPFGAGVLGNRDWAMVAISFISTWQFVGLPMILFYAVLITIPQDLIDAARVDGAGIWATFRRIKLPLLWPTIAMISIVTFISDFNAFELIYTLKGGAPGPTYATDVLGTLFYREFFGWRFQPGNPGVGAAVGCVTLVVIVLGVLVYVAARRRIHSYEF